jgi:hypothetical protein
MPVMTRIRNRQRRGAPWTEEEDQRLLTIAHLPPRAIADRMRRSWLACRRRLIYLRADGDGSAGALAGRSSKRS